MELAKLTLVEGRSKPGGAASGLMGRLALASSSTSNSVGAESPRRTNGEHHPRTADEETLLKLLAAAAVPARCTALAQSNPRQTSSVATAVAGGSANAMTCGVAARPVRTCWILTSVGANSSTTPTYQPLGLVVQVITRQMGSSLLPGDILRELQNAIGPPLIAIWVIAQPVYSGGGGGRLRLGRRLQACSPDTACRSIRLGIPAVQLRQSCIPRSR